MSAIVQLYVKKILNGEITINQVPTRWRAAVEEELIKIRNKE